MPSRSLVERFIAQVVGGDHVGATRDGSTVSQEEVAWQTWRADKIAAETFFYDPDQGMQSAFRMQISEKPPDDRRHH